MKTYCVTDFWGQIIARYLTRTGAETLAIHDNVELRAYRAVRCEQTNETVVTFCGETT